MTACCSPLFQFLKSYPNSLKVKVNLPKLEVRSCKTFCQKLLLDLSESKWVFGFMGECIWICQHIHSYLLDSVCWLVRSCMYTYRKLHGGLSKAFYGFAKSWMWIFEKLHVEWFKAAWGVLRSWLWIGQKMYETLFEAKVRYFRSCIYQGSEHHKKCNSPLKNKHKTDVKISCCFIYYY